MDWLLYGGKDMLHNIKSTADVFETRRFQNWTCWLWLWIGYFHYITTPIPIPPPQSTVLCYKLLHSAAFNVLKFHIQQYKQVHKAFHLNGIRVDFANTFMAHIPRLSTVNGRQENNKSKWESFLIEFLWRSVFFIWLHNVSRMSSLLR